MILQRIIVSLQFLAGLEVEEGIFGTSEPSGNLIIKTQIKTNWWDMTIRCGREWTAQGSKRNDAGKPARNGHLCLAYENIHC
jgi:hypothetical protein